MSLKLQWFLWDMSKVLIVLFCGYYIFISKPDLFPFVITVYEQLGTKLLEILKTIGENPAAVGYLFMGGSFLVAIIFFGIFKIAFIVAETACHLETEYTERPFEWLRKKKD